MFIQSKLKFGQTELQPVISSQTVDLHYNKHHASYTNNANAIMQKIEKARTTDDFMWTKSLYKDLSFNLNGHLLHELYWSCLRAPREDNVPQKEMKDKIVKNFGSFEFFKKEFTATAMSVEGSGWAVLYKLDDSLIISQVQSHNLLGLAGIKIVLCVDVWEHAYYLDYKNDRGAYLENWWKLVDWEFVKTAIK